MSTGRRIRWVVLAAMLVGGLSWLVRSIVGLSRSANQYGRTVTRAQWSTSVPSALYEHAARADQKDWGISVMTAVALVAFTLVMMFIHAFLRDPRKESR